MNYQHLSQNQLIKLLEEKDREILKHTTQIDFLLNLIYHLPGNIFWKDLNGNFLGCNNNVAKILSLSSPEDIIGKTNSELFDVKLAEKADKIDYEVINTGKEISIEEIGINSNKIHAVYLSKKAPLIDKQGNTTGIMGVSFDISDLKKLERDLKTAKEKAESSEKAKSRFLALINHELRTPLTAIIGLINILKQDNLPTDKKIEILENLQECGQYLLNLINNVLDFTRLESNMHEVKKVITNLGQLIDRAIVILSVLAREKGLKIYTNIDKVIPDILTDPELLFQILVNLITNAIKFTQKGFIKVEISSHENDKNHLQLKIAISDTGIGIPYDKQELIFEPFQQLKNTYIYDSSRQGTGLGLSIVKKLADLLDIDINVKSELEKGTTFTLTGKFLIANESTTTVNQLIKTKLLSKNFIKPTHPPNVLLVEDDKMIQIVHEAMLRELGCQVDIAGGGYEAIKKLNNHNMIIVDIGLPDISGFELIERLRQNKNNDHIPIIALTGYLGEEEKSRCFVAGADEVLAKPISLENLKKYIINFNFIVQ